jgi:hypothetical protein
MFKMFKQKSHLKTGGFFYYFLVISGAVAFL